MIGPPLPPPAPRIWEPGDSPFGTVPRCWAEMAHSPVGEFCSNGCGAWWFERAKLTPADHLACKDPHAHLEHLWGAAEQGTRWLYCGGRDSCPPRPDVDRWITDTAYAPDDFVFGDAGLTDRQLPALHELLDLVRPGWRELLLPPPPRGHGYTRHGWPCCDRCPSGPRPEHRFRCMKPPACPLCAVDVQQLHEFGGFKL